MAPLVCNAREVSEILKHISVRGGGLTPPAKRTNTGKRLC